MKKSSSTFICIISLIGFLVSCGSSSESSINSNRFETVLEMRDAFIAVGGVCTNWKTRNIPLATEAGSCSDASVLSVYSSKAVAEEELTSTKANLAKLDPNLLKGKLHRLIGENWILNDSDSNSLNEFQKRYGGELITSYDQIP